MKSIWSLDSQLPKFKPLKSDIKTHVCVIGAGITGILTTYLLKEQGIDCILIEANTIASGVTPYTSAKITCQHGLIYDKIINQFGMDKANQYAKANLDALNMYRTIIKNKNIDCNFETIPTYLYTTKDPNALDLEFSAMKSLGLRVSLTTKTTLPFEVKAALKIEEQAQFNPLAFLNFISSKLPIY